MQKELSEGGDSFLREGVSITKNKHFSPNHLWRVNK